MIINKIKFTQYFSTLIWNFIFGYAIVYFTVIDSDSKLVSFHSMCQLCRFIVLLCFVIILYEKNWHTNGFYLLKMIYHYSLVFFQERVYRVYLYRCIANPFLCFSGRKSSFKVLESKIVYDKSYILPGFFSDLKKNHLKYREVASYLSI